MSDEPVRVPYAPPSNYKSDDDDGVHTVGEFIAAFAALDPDLPVWLDNGECRSWPAQLPVALPVPVMRTDYPESVSHMVPGVWLS